MRPGRSHIHALPTGQFAGNPVLPQDLVGANTAQLLDEMSDDPGIRLASSRGRRTFRAGGLHLQTFDQHGGPNSEEALERVPLTAGTISRAMGQRRNAVPYDPGSPA